MSGIWYFKSPPNGLVPLGIHLSCLLSDLTNNKSIMVLVKRVVHVGVLITCINPDSLTKLSTIET